MESLEDNEEFTVVDSLPPTTEIEQQEYTKENGKQIKKKNEHVKKVNDAVIKIKKLVAKLITNNNCNSISEKPEKFFDSVKDAVFGFGMSMVIGTMLRVNNDAKIVKKSIIETLESEDMNGLIKSMCPNIPKDRIDEGASSLTLLIIIEIIRDLRKKHRDNAIVQKIDLYWNEYNFARSAGEISGGKRRKTNKRGKTNNRRKTNKRRF